MVSKTKIGVFHTRTVESSVGSKPWSVDLFHEPRTALTADQTAPRSSFLVGAPLADDVHYWRDIVAKVFLRCRTKILRAADAVCARRCEGACRLIQNRSRASIVALKSGAA